MFPSAIYLLAYYVNFANYQARARAIVSYNIASYNHNSGRMVGSLFH